MDTRSALRSRDVLSWPVMSLVAARRLGASINKDARGAFVYSERLEPSAR